MLGIKYKCRDGWHIFTADRLPGLFVMSRDLRLAMADLEPSIVLLRRLDGVAN